MYMEMQSSENLIYMVIHHLNSFQRTVSVCKDAIFELAVQNLHQSVFSKNPNAEVCNVNLDNDLTTTCVKETFSVYSPQGI